MIESEAELVPYSLQVVPFGSCSIVSSGDCGVCIDLNSVDDRYDMLPWVSIWLASDCDELWLVAFYAAFLLEFADTCDLWILTVVNKASWEGIASLERRPTSRDQ